tara:strand:+ start:6918 stop:7922 length:1005 start_codon:yes stop_codon:yes gene_type:complete
MGFLDNTGDIILDVVLTDHGRKQLSKGDGSFKITKFALGDEEIDYSLYNSTHASGSSYYDLEILQTPVLEAFTDNAASMKTKLVTYESLDLLFLPILELNELIGINKTNSETGTFVVAVDRFTEDDDDGNTTKGIAIDSSGGEVAGVLRGESLEGGTSIVIDQGLDTTQISTKSTLDADLIETAFTIQIDNRFGSIVDVNGNQLELSYIDDDNIAYYIVSAAESRIERVGGLIAPVGLPLGPTQTVKNISNLTKSGDSPIAGPRGSRLEFKIKASLDLQTSSFLFTKLGGTSTMINNTDGVDTSDLYHIDSIVRVSGMNTGYSLDLPVRFVKLQ